MGKAEKALSGEDDFRVRVAREKRERMRLRLLQATMRLCAERKGAGPLVIDDVVQEAEVSRGTFYKYFESVDEVVEALGRYLVDDLIHSLRMLLTHQPDPAVRICIGTCAVLMRASIEPAWGGFVGHTVYVYDASSMEAGMREALEDARKAGVLHYDNVDVAVDFHIGLMLQTIRRVVRSGFDEDHILGVAALALSGLGMERSTAAEIARKSLRELAEIGPKHLSWWPSKPLKALDQTHLSPANN